MTINIILADYSDPQHAKDICFLMNCYASDPMGMGGKLPGFVKENLINELEKIIGARTILCTVDDKPAGLINCFEGFSTFKCKPLINIHDIIVHKEFRGLGLSQKMLSKIESIAKERGCCKITLEVLSGNKPAQQAYFKFGFSAYKLDPEMGEALFWEKSLDTSTDENDSK